MMYCIIHFIYTYIDSDINIKLYVNSLVSYIVFLYMLHILRIQCVRIGLLQCSRLYYYHNTKYYRTRI